MFLDSETQLIRTATRHSYSSCLTPLVNCTYNNTQQTVISRQTPHFEMEQQQVMMVVVAVEVMEKPPMGCLEEVVLVAEGAGKERQSKESLAVAVVRERPPMENLGEAGLAVVVLEIRPKESLVVEEEEVKMRLVLTLPKLTLY